MKAKLEKKLKNFISFAMKRPCVLQIDIERITMNKEDKDEQCYRLAREYLDNEFGGLP